MTGLAERLGMRRSPSRPGTTGTFRLPPRVVSADPPHYPEPRPDEPFAPVYRHVPLSMRDCHGSLEDIRAPRWPDPIVFGPPGADPARVLEACGRLRVCVPCSVQWHDEAPQETRCWCCGRPAWLTLTDT